MVVYVLDSSALIRYIDNEAGANRVNAIIKSCVSGQAAVCMSAIQWGEVAGNIRKRMGVQREKAILGGILPSEVEIVSLNGDHAVRAAALRVDRKIAYADAFALDLAMQSSDCILVTADYGFKDVADLAHIEFLPAR